MPVSSDRISFSIMPSRHYLTTALPETGRPEDGATLTLMSSTVAIRLAAQGFQDPVDLDTIPGRFWILNIDANAMDERFEPGGVSMKIEARTSEIPFRSSMHFCEVIGGPFKTTDEMHGCFWISSELDRNMLSGQALTCHIPSWLVKRLEEQGHSFPLPFSDLIDSYWVCGMGGGVLSTRELEIRIRSDFALGHNITDGPFRSREDASYAFDSLWDSPA